MMNIIEGNKAITESINSLNDRMKDEHEKCIAQGYKDEICPKCDCVFLAHHHFVNCNIETCPMSNGMTLFQMMDEQLKSQTTGQSI